MDPQRLANRLMKVAVVLLSCMNSALWEVYTESPIMAMLWGAIALGFVIWIGDDMRRD